MGFYAKGSPGTVLHLTEKSDARGDITDDTIFHSSMPHVFIEKEWEVDLTNMKDKYTKVKPGTPAFSSNNFFKDVRLANIPSDLSSEISSGSNIIITEVVYEVDGVEYSKIINGLSLSNSFADEQGATDKTGPRWFEYNRVMQLSSLYQPGLGLNIAYFGDSEGNPRSLDDNNIDNSYGLISYAAKSNYYDLEANIYGVVFADKWVWGAFYNDDEESAYYTIKSNEVFPQNAMTGKRFNGVLVVPVNQRLGASSYSNPSYSNDTDGNVNLNGKIIDYQAAVSSPNYYKVRYISKLPLAQHPEGIWDYDKKYNLKNYTLYAETKYYRDGITFKKIRWYKLNLTFSNNKYSLINKYSRTGEITISSDKFMVNGLNIDTSTKKMLYHINKKPRKRPGSRIFYSNPSNTSTSQSSDNTIYFPLCGCDVNGNINISNNKSRGVPLNLENHNYLTTTKFNGGGWFCTPNIIGDKDGAIWEKGAIPLKVMPNNLTSVFSTISGEIDIKTTNTRKLISSIKDLGLSKTRDTATIFQVSTSDVFIHFPGTSYYRKVKRNNPTLNNDYKLSIDSTTTNKTYSDHSIMILPIKQYVPIITLNLFMRLKLTTFYDVYGIRSNTFIYWLYNRGDGGLDVYVSRNFKDWLQEESYQPSLDAQEIPIILPKLDFTIAKLS